MIPKKYALSAIVAAAPFAASASELSYTFLDFQRPDVSVDATGAQTPVANQTVRINALDGDGIAVAGSLKVGQRFYVGGTYKSSIVDVTGVISNPLVTVNVADTFDLVETSLFAGFIREIGDELDFIAELSYDGGNYDFGSFAGENFDLDDSGVGGRVGFRWNPSRPVELFVFGRYSPVAKPLLSERAYDSGSSVSAGVRWYFFETLGAGIEYESGEIDTMTISMRFSFGNLPW